MSEHAPAVPVPGNPETDAVLAMMSGMRGGT